MWIAGSSPCLTDDDPTLMGIGLADQNALAFGRWTIPHTEGHCGVQTSSAFTLARRLASTERIKRGQFRLREAKELDSEL